jgi:hypothetical protein
MMSPWAFQTLLKLEKKFYSRHHELVDSTQMTNDLLSGNLIFPTRLPLPERGYKKTIAEDKI